MTCGVAFWTPPWLTWCGLNKHPEFNLKEINRNDTHTLTHRDIHTLTIASLTHTCHCHWHPPAYRLWFVHLHDLIPCPILPLSITIDKPTLFINSWLIRLWVDNVLLINTRSLSIVIDKPIPLSIECPKPGPHVNTGEYLNTWVEYNKFGVLIELSTTGA